MATRQVRTALITGGQGTFAQALRVELEAAGYAVLSPGRRTLDVRCAENVARYFGDLSGLDLLINNAGIRCDRPFSKLAEADWDEVLRTNLTGAFLCSRAAGSLMLPQREGCILNVGSWSALNGPAGQAAYAAAKAGLIGLTQSLAREFGPAGIRVNCILPGWLETKFTEGVPARCVAAARAAHVLGRFITVAESARATVFISSLSSVSGQVFQFDSRIAPAF